MPPRQRSYDWSDPRILAQAATEMDGIEFLKRIGTGDLPPLRPVRPPASFPWRSVTGGRVSSSSPPSGTTT
ncbi:hypothetical protein GCM10022267_09800 [Lentzea roselyniae]|uniref:Uncharacterized protein n=1 Tax=Lentzea roselyniae TaxID=531940 RepID=A0ABP7A612_9PSEU